MPTRRYIHHLLGCVDLLEDLQEGIPVDLLVGAWFARLSAFSDRRIDKSSHGVHDHIHLVDLGFEALGLHGTTKHPGYVFVLGVVDAGASPGQGGYFGAVQSQRASEEAPEIA